MSALDEISPYEWLAQEFERLAILRKMWTANEVAAIIRRHEIPTLPKGQAEAVAWAEIAEHYRSAMLTAEALLNSLPMPVSEGGETSQVWKRISEVSGRLHDARQDMIHKHGITFLNSGPIGPASPAPAGRGVDAMNDIAEERIGKIRKLVEDHGSLEDQVRFDLIEKTIRSALAAPTEGK